MRLNYLEIGGRCSARCPSGVRRDRSKWSGIKTAIVIGALLGSLAPTAMALDQETWNFWEIAACPSENVEMNGRVRFLMQLVQGKERATWVFQAFWSGQASGLSSGAEYTIQGKWMEVIQEDPPYVFLWNDHFQLIGKGTAPNYDFYNKVRIVVDANGEPRLDFSGETTPCPTIDFDVWQ